MQNVINTYLYIFNYLSDSSHRSYYCKTTKRFDATAVKQAKLYHYIPDLIMEVVMEREASVLPLDAAVLRCEEDPRHVHPRRFQANKPTIETMVAVHQNRH